MKLRIERKWATSSAIVGTLTINTSFECYTLEDPDGAKDRIPAGKYTVIIDHSNRFGCLMPHVLGNGQSARGIRIHAGNTEADTEGCILVGCARMKFGKKDGVTGSKVAFKALFAKLQGQDQILLEVVETF